MMKKLGFLGSVALVAVMGATPASAQFRAALDVSRSAVQEGARSQQTIENLDAQAAELLGDYRASLKQRDVLRRFNASREREVQNQLEEIAGLEQDVENIQGLQRAVLPLLEDMGAELTAFVNADLPFLQGERQQRLARLQAIMEDSTQTAASRYNLILEAYQIENEYGRTMEAYTGEIDNDGAALTVDFLRVGRLALLYKSADDSVLRIYNRETGQFDDLDKKFLAEVRRGIRMANEQTPPDLLSIPVPAPVTQ
ncbi:MAG: DUF3450 domain-containing protein [Pseudomonadota bacterium]